MDYFVEVCLFVLTCGEPRECVIIVARPLSAQQLDGVTNRQQIAAN